MRLTMADTGRFWAAVQVDVEVPIEAPVLKVWQLMTQQVEKWWPISFCADKTRAKSFHWEMQLAGRMYEDWGNGDGWLWWTIYKLDSQNHLICAQGNMGNGVLLTDLTFTLHKRGSQTLLRIKEIVTGAIDDAAALEAGQIKGWNELFRDAFKPYAENSA